MGSYVLISTPQSLKDTITRLCQYPVIAVDTESDSLYHFFEKVCLVQISTPNTDFIIDPLQVDISPLGTIFESQSIEKIFHAAEYDILSLKRDYGFSFSNLFDTMLSAKILGWERVGLGSLLQTHIGVKLNKKFQQYNWGKRPLPVQALKYAYMDTHYLFELRRIQLAALATQNRVSEAKAAYQRITKITPSVKVFSPGDFWRVKGVKTLTDNQKATLQSLYVFRDEVARQFDMPAFKLMSDGAMITLAQTQPHSFAELKKTKGIYHRVLRQHDQALLDRLQQVHPMPKPRRRNGGNGLGAAAVMRYEHLRSWRNATAAKRGVEPDVILSNDTLRAIAGINPRNIKQLQAKSILGKWQFDTYATTIMEQLKSIQ